MGAGRGATLEEGNAIQKFMVLIADAYGGAPIQGSERLQKLLYMASREDDELGWQCRFETGSRGPHSGAVGRELVRLVGMGTLSDDGGAIVATPAGRSLAKNLSEYVDGDDLIILRNQRAPRRPDRQGGSWVHLRCVPGGRGKVRRVSKTKGGHGGDSPLTHPQGEDIIGPCSRTARQATRVCHKTHEGCGDCLSVLLGITSLRPPDPAMVTLTIR